MDFRMKKGGMTILEMISVLLLMSILALALNELYALGLNIWKDGFERNTARNRLSQSLDLISRSLRQARTIDALEPGSISFTADLGSGEMDYRFYLYHPSDEEPNPPYSQDSYELKFAQSDTGYGQGSVLATGIDASASVFTQLSDTIAVELTARYGDQSQKIRTLVGLRNL